MRADQFNYGFGAGGPVHDSRRSASQFADREVFAPIVVRRPSVSASRGIPRKLTSGRRVAILQRRSSIAAVAVSARGIPTLTARSTLWPNHGMPRLRRLTSWLLPRNRPWISETTTPRFEADVIRASVDRPVVVDFWAPWCGPCRQLTPILEKLATELDGRFQLVKINIDENPEIAQAFAVQSIPYVVALRDQQVVSEFMGVHPEDKLREWLNSILPSKAEELLKKGQALEATDPKGALAAYREAAALDPGNDAIKIALARVLLKLNLDDESRKIIADLEVARLPRARGREDQIAARTAGRRGRSRPARRSPQGGRRRTGRSQFAAQAGRRAGRRQPPRRGTENPVGHHPKGQNGRRRRGQKHDGAHLRHTRRRLRPRRHLPPQAGHGALLKRTA